MKIRPVEAHLFHANSRRNGWMDKRTDRETDGWTSEQTERRMDGQANRRRDMMKLIVSFRNFVNVPKNSTWCWHYCYVFYTDLRINNLTAFNTDWLLGAFAYLRMRLLASSCVSVRSHGTTRLPLEGFSWNLMCEDFLKICRRNSSLIKIGQEWQVLYMKTNTYEYFRSYLAQCFLEWKTFQKKIIEKREIHILKPRTFFENRAVFEKMWKNIVERDRPQMTIWRMRIACWIPKATNARTGCVILIPFPLKQWLH